MSESNQAGIPVFIHVPDDVCKSVVKEKINVIYDILSKYEVSDYKQDNTIVK